jgi:ABC-type polysaccharide/polyol phosphate transport system ATPase subunit/GT2 family glycosyltransferase
VSKCYRLYSRRRDQLKQALFGRWRRYYREVWALRDVSLEVGRGQIIGVLGPNGAGKSTLLQIIAGTVSPTAGRVQVHGRVAALLELGSGFHPEFTGRENVFLYGAILGLTNTEIHERFDAIAAFADIGPFLDCPLKTYSSGMAMRLAFSVASHLDPDVLLVDEALAVGDLRFQQRCLAHLRRLPTEGKTVLFVSHDLDTAKRLCDELLVLDHGRLLRAGSPAAIVNWYFGYMTAGAGVAVATGPNRTYRSYENCESFGGDSPFPSTRHGDGQGVITGVALLTENGEPAVVARMDGKYRVRIGIEFRAAVDSPVLGFYLRDRLGTDLIGVNTHEETVPLPPATPGDRLTIDFLLPLRLRPGHYSISPGLAHDPRESRYLDWWDNAIVFEIVDEHPSRTVYGLTHPEVHVEVRNEFCASANLREIDLIPARRDRGAEPSSTPQVSILIPTAGRAGRVLRCLDSIRTGTRFSSYEIMLVDNGPLPDDIESGLSCQDLRRLTLLQPFNFAANLNAAARRATGDYLLFLNDDTEVFTPDWLEGLLEFARLPGVGAVGAKLLFPDGRLQHAGVTIVDGCPGHPGYGEPAELAPRVPREYPAVTGACLMTPRSLFRSVGGFDERFSLNYNDVDYCLRLRELGWRVVCATNVELIHHEAMDRPGQTTVRPWELALFQQLWGARDARHGQLAQVG